MSFVHWRIGEELNCYCNNFHWHIWRGNREHFLCKSFCTVSASRTPLDLEAQSMKFWIICGWQNFFFSSRIEEWCCCWWAGGAKTNKKIFKRLQKQALASSQIELQLLFLYFPFFLLIEEHLLTTKLLLLWQKFFNFFWEQNLIFFALVTPKLWPIVQILKKGGRWERFFLLFCLLCSIVSYHSVWHLLGYTKKSINFPKGIFKN